MHMLRKVIGIVKMDDSFFMRVYNMLRQKKAARNVFPDFSGHIIPLHAVDRRIFIGIFLFYLFVVALQKRHNLLVRRIGLSNQRPFVTIRNIVTGNGKRMLLHNFIFYQILYFFDIQCAAHIIAGIFYAAAYLFDLFFCHFFIFKHSIVRLDNCGFNFGNVIIFFHSASFNNFHSNVLSLSFLMTFYEIKEIVPYIVYVVNTKTIYCYIVPKRQKINAARIF